MNKPYVIINCAMSVDGKISSPNKKQIRISCDEDIKRMHQLRNTCDAVLVGIDTIISDDPKLTVKDKYVKNPKQPIRIVLDSKCRIPNDSLVVNNMAKTIIFTSKVCNKNFGKNIEIIKCELDKNNLINLEEMLKLLFLMGVKKLLVEGGGTVIWNFINQEFVDDLYIYIRPFIIGGKKTPTMADGNGIKELSNPISLEFINLDRLGDGFLFHYRLIK